MEDKFINREISWLSFNERVLQEAVDPSTPLIERARFLGIYSNNRDEFFRVRVATLRRLLKFEINHGIEESTTKNTLEEIKKIVHIQEKKFTNSYLQLVKDLRKKRIYILNEKELSVEQGQYVRQYFDENLRSFLFPLMIKNFKNTGGLKDELFYLAVCLLKDDNEPDYALVEVPIGNFPRLIEIPGDENNYYLIFLDDIIRFCLDEVFSIFGYNLFSAYTIKFTRDAELDIDNDVSKSFLEIMTESVNRRKKGEPVRFIYDKSIPDDLLNILIKKFSITKRDNIRAGGRYHNMKDFMDFPNIGTEDLRYAVIHPVQHPNIKPRNSMLEAIRKQDIMLHFPYHSFHSIVDLLREVSIDPQVRAIKMTFYRVARDSKVMNALINASRNGKHVTVFMELQARFDEEANIYWTNKLQAEGVKIIQNIPGFKVHAKLILISRRENNENKYYANISTGNFNESTAKVYADESLLTYNQDIASEVNEVFNMFESKFSVPKFKHLIVAPFRIRSFFVEMLDKEIEFAKNGKNAWIVLKLNSLVDEKIIKKLYEASLAGVKITLIIRAICMIKTGIPELSENIEAFSIVDKYLEHSRMYIFHNGGDVKYYIASADWMQRNFDHRVEVVCPVYDENIQKELWDILQIQMRDNVKARWLDPKRLNTYRKKSSDVVNRAQVDIYNYLKENAQIKLDD